MTGLGREFGISCKTGWSKPWPRTAREHAVELKEWYIYRGVPLACFFLRQSDRYYRLSCGFRCTVARDPDMFFSYRRPGRFPSGPCPRRVAFTRNLGRLARQR